MTGSRFPGPPSGTEPGTWTPAAPPSSTTITSPGGARPPGPDRLTDHASPDAGVKATPLRGRPTGRALTPTPPRRAHTPGAQGKKKGQSPHQEVDQPRSFRNDLLFLL